MPSDVLAHYGGVPETLTIALPVAIFGGFLLLEKKARRRERDAAQVAGGEGDEAGPPDGGEPGPAQPGTASR